MQRTDILVVGGGIAGHTAALAARRYYYDKKVTLVRREVRALIPWGLAYASAAGTLDRYVLSDAWLHQASVNLVIDGVVAIDRRNQCVTTACGEEISYEKMILATGSSPSPLPLKGAHLPGIFVLKKELPHLKEMQQRLAEARNLVIVGGGLNGVEMALACSARPQQRITLVELLPRCLARVFNHEFCELAEEKLRQQGVEIITAAGVAEFLGRDRVEQVKLSNGLTLPADVVILANGALPRTDLARQAGLEMDAQAGILVDDYLRTSDAAIFAAGDCAAPRSLAVPGVPLPRQARMAGQEARVAAANLFTLQRRWENAVARFAVAIGDLALGAVGLVKDLALEARMVEPPFASISTVVTGDLTVRVAYGRENGITLGALVQGQPQVRVRETMDYLATAIQQQTPFAELVLA
ncbi:NAD(P)/FAD-dependent oxidoreductase [Moorella naiadis]|uniref:NAD(P)/FAD-dependent oxidoreductase n=1 Tax=Moorella naiadis (nom. illeg.) TaxID=3093670 RepID=UPI003D9C8678